jgi:C-terminal processing protease CtpA/Prc
MHAVDPVQRLRLLLHRLDQSSPQALPSEMAFHREMTEIFTSVRDLHTNYLLPAPFKQMQAFLPFDVEEYFDDGVRRYVVSHIVPGFTHPTFAQGVDVLRWNGVPIDRAVDVLADRHPGSNLAARHARGLERLTFRPLVIAPPPDEEWVLVDYRTEGGDEHQLRFDWVVFPLPADAEGTDPDALGLAASAQGIDLEMDLIQRAKKILLAPRVVAAERDLLSREARETGLASNMPSKLEAREVVTAHGTFGYLRIRSFNVEDPGALVAEFLRLAALLPQGGLILDVRGNGGGHILASEFLLQTLTPRAIEPEPVQFINTPLNLRLTRRHRDNPVGIDLSPWVDSIAQAVETGAPFSRGFPITPVEGANAIGQRYHGPVVLITDARSYSATDIFAAGFQDHAIGPILGVDDNTGAGGANVMTHKLLADLLELPAPADPDSPYESLPGGAGMRVSIRRTLRVGERAGTPVEDLGVVPDERHFMSRADVLRGNVDLIEHAARLLAARPIRRLEVQATVQPGGGLRVEVSSTGISRLDVFLDARPRQSVDVTGLTTAILLPSPAAGAGRLEVRGFDADRLVAARRVEL